MIVSVVAIVVVAIVVVVAAAAAAAAVDALLLLLSLTLSCVSNDTRKDIRGLVVKVYRQKRGQNLLTRNTWKAKQTDRTCLATRTTKKILTFSESSVPQARC